MWTRKVRFLHICLPIFSDVCNLVLICLYCYVTTWPTFLFPELINLQLKNHSLFMMHLLFNENQSSSHLTIYKLCCVHSRHTRDSWKLLLTCLIITNCAVSYCLIYCCWCCLKPDWVQLWNILLNYCFFVRLMYSRMTGSCWLETVGCCNWIDTRLQPH